MQFTTGKVDFLDALRKAEGAVPAKSMLQILGNFHISLSGDTLEVTATNLELSVRSRLQVQGQGDGAVLIDARTLVGIVSHLDPDVDLEVSAVDNQVKLKSGSYVANLPGFDPAEYPQIEQPEDGIRFSLTSSELLFLEEKTSFACSTDVTRIALNGIFVEHQDGRLSMVATDGHRLGLASVENAGADWPNGVIVPPKALRLLLKSVPADTALDVRIGASHVSIDSERIQVVGRPFDGTYPVYRNVVPTEFGKIATVDVRRLISVTERIGTIANAKTSLVKFEFSEGRLTVSASNQDDGNESHEELGVEYTGEPGFRLGFNAKYLVEILKMCPERISLQMNSPTGACVITPVGEGLDFYFLLMPLRLSEGN